MPDHVSKPEAPGLEQALARRGISRRQFVKFCALIAATLALPKREVKTISRALAAAPRLPVVWIEFQGCTGDTESFLRAGSRPDPLIPGQTDPSITELLLEVLSVNYHETIMVPSGDRAEQSRTDTIRDANGQYVCVIEGSIPTANNGAYCVIGGRTALSIVQEACTHAAGTIALGSCATDGGLAGASPNPTGAVGVSQAVSGAPNLINLPGCPANVVNLVATLVYYITYHQWPARDGSGRPTFAYGGDEIHKHCERRQHYEDDRFVLSWGDQGHRNGWCLKRMGCKGPSTRHNCPQVKWNDGTNWPIGAGHHCIGCARPHFWDASTPFYGSSDGGD